MIKAVLRIIFRKKRWVVDIATIKADIEAADKARQERFEAEKKRRREELLGRIHRIDKGSEILCDEINKHGEEVLVTRVISGKNLEIKLHSLSRTIFNIARVESTIYKDCYVSHINIDDVISSYKGRGNGSIVLKHFINTVGELNSNCRLGIKYISGWLSPIDKENFNKLEYFYAKSGFEVNFTDDRESGSIRMEL